MTNDGTLAQQAYEALRERLSAGTLPPGTRLVNRTLAAELGLSMTPVREAITRLVGDGIVEFVAGAGAYVRRIEERDLTQLYELRELLEPYAAAQAARHATPQQLDDLDRLSARGLALAERHARGAVPSDGPPRQPAETLDPTFSAAWSKLEGEFHLAVFRAAHNPWLLNAVDGLRLLHRLSLAQQALHERLLDAATVRRTATDHDHLRLAIKARDGAAAERLMREHIARGKRHVLDRLRESNRESTSSD